MTRIRLVLIAFLCLLTTGLSMTCSAEVLPEAESSRVKQIQSWLDRLSNKSPESIIKDLGEPKEKRTWEFEGKTQPRWEYSSETPKYTLLLFFHEGSVVNVSIQIQSN